MRRRGIHLRNFYVWHRRLGAGAALLVILFALTGLPLNHSHELGLAQRHVQSNLLLDWYGIHAPEDITSLPAGGHWISQAGERLYLDAQEIPLHPGPLRGAVALPGMLVLATDSQLILLNEAGEVVEQLGEVNGIPAGIQAIAAADGRLLAKTPSGTWISDELLFTWQRDENVDAQWSRPAELPDALRSAIDRAYRGKGLSLERLLLDLHSGRLWGNWGVWVMDAAALAMLFLGGSGAWVWWRRQRHLRQQRRQKQRR